MREMMHFACVSLSTDFKINHWSFLNHGRLLARVRNSLCANEFQQLHTITFLALFRNILRAEKSLPKGGTRRSARDRQGGRTREERRWPCAPRLKNQEAVDQHPSIFQRKMHVQSEKYAFAAKKFIW